MSEHLDNPLPPPVTDEARRLRGELDLVTKSRDAWEAEARLAKIEAAAQRDGDRAWMEVEVARFRDKIAETEAQAARAKEDRLAAYRLLDKALADAEGLKAELAQAQTHVSRAEAEKYGQGQYLDSARAEIEDLHAAIEARDREIAALKATPPKVWRRTEITPAPDLATCVRLLSLARGTEEVEAVARVVARLLGQGGAA